MKKYLNPGLLEFEATIQRASETGTSAYVTFPWDLKETFGSAAWIPVNATFDGAKYRGSVGKYGGDPMIIVLTQIQEEIGKKAGDRVKVTIELDELPRVVELDEDVQQAFEQAHALDNFRAMSYSHQREYSAWITSAKRAE
ncbi:MAG: YdeI/OmpD-associated family protein, partial [Microbacteriaceae bacterium]